MISQVCSIFVDPSAMVSAVARMRSLSSCKTTRRQPSRQFARTAALAWICPQLDHKPFLVSHWESKPRLAALLHGADQSCGFVPRTLRLLLGFCLKTAAEWSRGTFQLSWDQNWGSKLSHILGIFFLGAVGIIPWMSRGFLVVQLRFAWSPSFHGYVSHNQRLTLYFWVPKSLRCLWSRWSWQRCSTTAWRWRRRIFLAQWWWWYHHGEILV